MRDLTLLNISANMTETSRSTLVYNKAFCARFPDFRGCLAHNSTMRSGTWLTACEVFVQFDSGEVFVDPGSVSSATPGLIYNGTHSFPIIKAGHHLKLSTWLP